MMWQKGNVPWVDERLLLDIGLVDTVNREKKQATTNGLFYILQYFDIVYHNRFPAKVTESMLHKLPHRRKLSLGHIKVFGFYTFAYVLKWKRNKLNWAVRKKQWLNTYNAASKRDMNRDPATQIIEIHNIVYFDEREKE